MSDPDRQDGLAVTSFTIDRFSGRRSLAVLLLSLLLVSFALGYHTLNRYDLALVPANYPDAKAYADMAHFSYSSVSAPFRFRVAIPTMVGVILPVVQRAPLGSWDRTACAFLIVNATLLSFAALLVFTSFVLLFRDGQGGVIAALLYVTCWPVPSLHLAGLVDTGEALSVSFALWALIRGRWRWMPLLAVCAVLAKETAVLWICALQIGWWVGTPRPRRRRQDLGWCFASMAAGAIAVVIVRYFVGDGPFAHGAGVVARVSSLPKNALSALVCWPVFVSFGPFVCAAILVRTELPRDLKLGTACCAFIVFCAASVAGLGSNTVRPMFNACGGPLAMAGALLLTRMARRWKESRR